MATTQIHTNRCIESATISIEENNLDTLVERGINDRLAGLTDWLAQNRLVDVELEAAYEAGTLSRPTPELAAQWLAEGTVSCRCND